jgi:molybdopterin synthase catalytic subunit
MPYLRTALSAEPLEIHRAIDEAGDDGCGAVASFVGRVRISAAVAERAEDKVESLEYEAEPSLAEARLRAIAEEAASRWDLARVIAVHRVGTCPLGEPTVVVACGAPHRREALEGCHWIIDQIKGSVPIWKREVYEDGSSWVGPES